MNTPLPALDETPEALKRRLSAAPAGHHSQRVPARTRRQVARRRGISRQPVGRWRAASETGGGRRMSLVAQAPGNVPPVPHTGQDALRQRRAPPAGCARAKALGPWLPSEDGGQSASKTVQRLGRDTWRANLQAPRPSPSKTPGRGRQMAGAVCSHAAA
jgi:hypothetical protein